MAPMDAIWLFSVLLVVLATPVKWWAIQLPIQCILDTMNYHTLSSYGLVEKYM